LNPFVFKFGYYCGPPIAGAYLSLVKLTSRVEVVNEDVIRRVREEYGPGIYTIWHNRLLYPAYYFGHYRPHAVISRSHDGDLIAHAAGKWGYQPIRGSSSRGGVHAFIRVVRELEQGRDVVITPDGPRGPREKVQPGVAALARHTGYPVVPVSYDASRRYRFRSWDRFILPLPFSRVKIVMGEPIPPIDDNDELVERIEAGLREATRVAESGFHPPEEDGGAPHA